jgi:predicted nucleic acid-binding protein
MVSGLLDTAIIVDLLRSYSPAQNWILGQKDLGTSSAVWLEIIQGAHNNRELRAALRLLRSFDRVDPTPEDFAWTIQMGVQFRLSHNIGSIDCLIASTSYRLQIPLYTPNLKHFAFLLGPLAQKPY